MYYYHFNEHITYDSRVCIQTDAVASNMIKLLDRDAIRLTANGNKINH